MTPASVFRSIASNSYASPESDTERESDSPLEVKFELYYPMFYWNPYSWLEFLRCFDCPGKTKVCRICNSITRELPSNFVLLGSDINRPRLVSLHRFAIFHNFKQINTETAMASSLPFSLWLSTENLLLSNDRNRTLSYWTASWKTLPGDVIESAIKPRRES